MSEVRLQNQSFTPNLVHSLYVIKEIARNQLQNMQDPAGSTDDKTLLAKAADALNETLEQTSRIIEMIQHLKHLAFGAEGLHRKSPLVSMPEMVGQILHAMQYEFPFQHITVVKMLPHDFPQIPIEPEHLEAILSQLMLNARESLGNMAGVITIEADEKTSQTWENQTCRRIILRISHTGPAIEEHEMPHLFDPFFEARSGPRTNGLALYVVKKIVEINGGMIRVEASRRGMTFHVELPG